MAHSLQDHLIVFPFMAHGHTLPLLDLSVAMSGTFGVKVTIVTTPSNTPEILSRVSAVPNISVSVLPFPRVEGLPAGCENTADLPSMDLHGHFVAATRSLRKPFEDFLRKACEDRRAPPLCVISDLFLSWTLEVCNQFGVPRIVFHGMGVLSLSISKAAFQSALDGFIDSHAYNPGDNCAIDTKTLGLSLPFQVYKDDVPALELMRSLEDPTSKAMAEIGESDKNSWGVLVNSFEGLEGEYVASLEKFMNPGAKAWCVGPSVLWKANKQLDSLTGNHKSSSYLEWLDRELVVTDGVIYASFGTQCHLSNEQMDEIALGLERSGKYFIWVVRSTSWVCSDKGWETRSKDKGLIVREWVDQRVILSHPSVRGFVSHCGWNSVLESLCYGVPILAWPMDYDQPLNALIMAKAFGAGILLKDQDREAGGILKADVISEGIKELMGRESGKQVRERAEEIRRKAREAVEKGGSSYKKMDEMIQCLKLKRERAL